MKESGIYSILCLSSGKRYIGRSVDLKGRLQGHRSDLKCGTHVNPHLQYAWNKYGGEAFVFEVLELVSNIEDLPKREGHYCQLFQAHNPEQGYNSAEIDLSGHSLPSEESRKKMSKAQKGRKHSEETKAKIRANGNRGRKFGSPSPEHRAKLAEARRKWKLSLESRAKLSASLKGRPKSEEHIRKMSESLKGKPRTPESIEKQRKTCTGKTTSPETKEKMSKKNKGRQRSEEDKANMRAGNAEAQRKWEMLDIQFRSCSICGQLCHSSSGLNTHYRRKHKEPTSDQEGPPIIPLS